MIVKWSLLLVAIIACLLGTLQLADGKSACDPVTKSCKGLYAGRQLNGDREPVTKESKKPLGESVADKTDVADEDDIQANDNNNDKEYIDEDNDVTQKPTDKLDEDKKQSVNEEGESSIARLIRRQLRKNRRYRRLRWARQRRRRRSQLNRRRNRLRSSILQRYRLSRNRVSRLINQLRRRRRIPNESG